MKKKDVMGSNKRVSKATIVFGYIFSIITIIAAVFVTVAYIKDKSKKNDLADVLLILLALAFAAVILYISFAITYSGLLLSKAKKIDGLVKSKKAKTIDLMSAIVIIVLTAVALAMVIFRNTSADEAKNTLITLVVLSVCFDISVVFTLLSTIYNTIQYKKELLPIFNKHSNTIKK